jgi:hypothetical protein
MQGGRHRGYVLRGTTLFNHWIITEDAYQIDLGTSAITYGTHPVPDYALRKSHIAWARDIRGPNRTGDMFYAKRSLPAPYPSPHDIEQSHFTVDLTDSYRVHGGLPTFYKALLHNKVFQYLLGLTEFSLQIIDRGSWQVYSACWSDRL